MTPSGVRATYESPGRDGRSAQKESSHEQDYHRTTLHKPRNAAHLARETAVWARVGGECSESNIIREQIAARATKLAAEAWPAVRTKLASDDQDIPSGPITNQSYEMSGGGRITRDGEWQWYTSVVPSRSPIPGYEPPYIALAIIDLAPEFHRRAARAEAAFEAYRLAVAQGVAVPPAD